MTDWYVRRSELEPGQVFIMNDGRTCQLDCRVEGDGSDWMVFVIENGRFFSGVRIHPSDLTRRIMVQA